MHDAAGKADAEHSDYQSHHHAADCDERKALPGQHGLFLSHQPGYDGAAPGSQHDSYRKNEVNNGIDYVYRRQRACSYKI